MNYCENSFPRQSFYKLNNIVKLQPPWWIKIATSKPKCVYYFRSFSSKEDAIDALPGYVEDLEQEQAQGILIEIKQSNPQKLTDCESRFEEN